jgi:hypothetical protein
MACMYCGSEEHSSMGCPKRDESRGALVLRVDLDTSTYVCPCGSSFTWGGFDEQLRPWLEVHRPHTNGSTEETITADGCRATGGVPTTRVIHG